MESTGDCDDVARNFGRGVSIGCGGRFAGPNTVRVLDGDTLGERDFGEIEDNIIGPAGTANVTWGIRRMRQPTMRYFFRRMSCGWRRTLLAGALGLVVIGHEEYWAVHSRWD